MTYTEIIQQTKNENKRIYKKGKRRITSVLFSLCLCFCLMMFSGIFASPVVNLAMPFVTKFISVGAYELLCNIALYTFCITLPFLIPALVCRTSIKKVFAFYPKLTRNPFGFTVFVFGICILFNLIMSALFPWYSEVFASEAVTYESNGEILLQFIQIAIFPALLEEIVFRGVFITALRPMGTRFAVVLSAMLFGLAHFDPLQSLFACLFGLLIGTAYVATGSLWPGIIIHFLNNSFSIFATYGNDFVLMLLGLMLYGVMIYAVIYLIRYFRMPAKYPLCIKEERESMLNGDGYSPVRAVLTNAWTYILLIVYVAAIILMYLPSWLEGGTVF